ncbi:RNA/RNP complex-1-interacting phosphatase homolog isoform X2 [Halichondria panicea]|uniref:RNA/RNP complex-1-interacting phosphatase homolog isoform X2 n=1 Tax=Halichondria panicea TaxID=6063 RepID=UPI00312BB1F8
MAEGASPAVDTYRRFPGSLTVPEEWFDYTRYGEVIPGTRIIAVKTPLKKEFNNGRPQSKSWTKYDFGVCTEDEFTPQQLMDALTDKGLKLSAIIDLTYTNRYYSSAEFEDAGVTHIKIKCPGKVVPSDDIYCRFASALKESLNSSDDPRTVVAVHCTHGVNRTGYLLCRYLMQEKSFTADRAIRKVQEARGHVMKKYLEPLRKRSPSAPSRSRPPPPQETRPPHQHHNTVHRKHPRPRPSPHKPQECTHPHHTKETGHLNRGWDRRRGRSDNDTNWRAPPLTQQDQHQLSSRVTKAKVTIKPP